MFTLYVTQRFNGEVIEGYLSAACDELTDRFGTIGHFTLEQVAAILPTLDYGDCQLLSVQVRKV